MNLIVISDKADNFVAIKSISKENNYKEILYYEKSIEDLLYSLEKNSEINLFIISFDSEQVCSDIAVLIRSINKFYFTPIIIINSKIHNMFQVYRRTHCFDYFSSPYDKRLKVILEKKTKNEKINLINKSQKKIIELEEILYVECLNRRIFIQTFNERIEYKCMTLKKFGENLSEDFLRIHQSIMVNKKYITRIDKRRNVLYLKNAVDLPIGRSFKSVF
ncbi:LytTr DNA-binding domain-containing protein [Natranaerovirga hydrolytica]|uniref:LytTr DNA-binding domain-containing protein n=1 Tax=Natranaerovirga hydrolytica TaxID=680378 RepID=A0A4R1MZE0_9FIRM|nr:LytTR family DNA-binding domain-containing protein [Natranaerovirga hydrolytica]TCK98646.1 LytTr DNA-binding domain-containing protein [Natranaerovirga hydrolytica]